MKTLRNLSISIFVATILGCGAAPGGNSEASEPLPTPPPGIQMTEALPTVYLKTPNTSGVAPKDAYFAGGNGGSTDYVWSHHFSTLAGRSGAYVDGVQFTSDGGVSNYYGGGGGSWFSVPCSDGYTPGYYQVGLVGGAGDYVDRIGPYCGTDTAVGSTKNTAGGNGGSGFQYRCNLGTHIIGWRVSHGDFVDSLTAYCGQ